MTKITPTAALTMNLFDLATACNWHDSLRNHMALFVYQKNDKPIWNSANPYMQLLRDWLVRVSQEVTLQQVIEKLEQQYRQVYIYNYWAANRTHLGKICSLGFTRLDSIALPQSTITIELLKTLPRPKLLALDGRLLGTIPEPVMAAYRSRLNMPRGVLPPPFTIKELLENSEVWRLLPPKVERNTIPVLQELGLANPKGVASTPKPLPKLSLPDLLKTKGVSQELAAQLVASAATIKANWQKATPANDQKG